MTNVCPISRLNIEANDLFEYKTKSGKLLKYSAQNVFDWVEHSGKAICPLTREEFNHLSLEKIQKCVGKKFTFFKKYLGGWKRILNTAFRQEAQVAFDVYKKQWEEAKEENHALLSHCVAILICQIKIAGRASYRQFLKKNRGPTARKIEGLIVLLAQWVTVSTKFTSTVAQIRFISNLDCPPEEVNDIILEMLKKLPSYDIKIAYNLISYIRGNYYG